MLGVLTDKCNLWLLAFMAGFVDTATFLGADELFSAHVTGNFVVFAANGGSKKLLTFPAFAIGVLIVAFFESKKMLDMRKSLMLISGLLITGVAGTRYFGQGDFFFFSVLIFVVAMGIQNAAHKIYLKGTPTSTVMTGNVTQFFLDVFSPAKSAIYFSTIQMVIAFFLGCLSGAYLTNHFGLTSILTPACLAILLIFLQRK